MILGVSFDSNGIGIVTRILFVLCYAVKMIMLVLWVDSEMDMMATLFYLSFCGTYSTSSLHTQTTLFFASLYEMVKDNGVAVERGLAGRNPEGSC